MGGFKGHSGEPLLYSCSYVCSLCMVLVFLKTVACISCVYHSYLLDPESSSFFTSLLLPVHFFPPPSLLLCYVAINKTKQKQDPQMRENVTCLFFSVWLILFNMVIPSYIFQKMR